MKYSQERKRAVLAKLASPYRRTVKDVAAEADIAPATLYHWRQQAHLDGGLFPDDGADPEGWTARNQCTAVMVTAPLNESERAEYCRKRGLYPQQITAWRRACESATDWADERSQQQTGGDREVRREARSLKRELQRKEKALTETAALLTLPKKPGRSGERARTHAQHPRLSARRIADR